MRGESSRTGRRLGIYVDAVYRASPGSGEERVAVSVADLPFLLFACEVGRYFDATVLFGRTVDTTAPGGFAGLPHGVELVELPTYPDLRHLFRVFRAAVGTLRGFWRGLERVDVVWVLGPHPFGFLLITLALLRRRRVVLGVRQDTLRYYESRLPGRGWRPLLAVVRLMDAAHRLLARRLRTVVVGAQVAERYGRRESVLPIAVSLVRADDVVREPAEHDWSGQIGLLTVGRLEPEKNPLLLVEALSELEHRRPGRYRLTWFGTGWLEADIRRRAAELGIERLIDLRGFVPFGRELLERYRQAHALVHVSLTEGVPQVLIEALASGIPIVATDVGGVRGALQDGDAGLLVPASNRAALVEAVERLSDDGELRIRLVTAGLSLARALTLEGEAGRVARFLGARIGQAGPRPEQTS
jgi:glycosyltransferase involved in cell wall biosynthesis